MAKVLLAETKDETIYCPLTKQIFCEPVVTLAGSTYEKEAIEDWLKCSSIDPTTGNPLDKEILSPNLYIKTKISNLLQKQPGLLNEVYIPIKWKDSFIAQIKSNNVIGIQGLLKKQPRLINIFLEKDQKALHIAAKFASKETFYYFMDLLKTQEKGLVERMPLNHRIFEQKQPELSNYFLQALEKVGKGR